MDTDALHAIHADCVMRQSFPALNLTPQERAGEEWRRNVWRNLEGLAQYYLEQAEQQRRERDNEAASQMAQRGNGQL